MNVAFLFPGQGSQVPGMLHTLPDHPTITRTLDEVSETLKQNVLQLDSPEALRSTVSVQLALLASGVAVARTLIARGVEPGAVAGMSAGTLCPPVNAGVLGLSHCVPALKRRGGRVLETYPTRERVVPIGGFTAEKGS